MDSNIYFLLKRMLPVEFRHGVPTEAFLTFGLYYLLSAHSDLPAPRLK
jgi:hypothetical protein